MAAAGPEVERALDQHVLERRHGGSPYALNVTSAFSWPTAPSNGACRRGRGGDPERPVDPPWRRGAPRLVLAEDAQHRHLLHLGAEEVAPDRDAGRHQLRDQALADAPGRAVEARQEQGAETSRRRSSGEAAARALPGLPSRSARSASPVRASAGSQGGAAFRSAASSCSMGSRRRAGRDVALLGQVGLDGLEVDHLSAATSGCSAFATCSAWWRPAVRRGLRIATSRPLKCSSAAGQAGALA